MERQKSIKVDSMSLAPLPQMLTDLVRVSPTPFRDKQYQEKDIIDTVERQKDPSDLWTAI